MSDKVIAIGEIQLIPVNDGLVLSMSPSSCVIKADYDGGNPDLDQAMTEISLLAGDAKIPFECEITEISNDVIKYSLTTVDSYVVRIRITSVPVDVLSGYIKFKLTTQYGSSVYGLLQFSIIRESTMLGWIQDWESNKTSIGGSYLITPKIFVGKKITTTDDLKVLTGVYIGPDKDNGAGIYGYKEGKEIFHINEYGGSIGGWDISNGGIQTLDGNFQLLSEGSILAKDANQEILWGIYKSGEAVFAKGNVQFHQDGSALFKGKITSSEGQIGGWKIEKNLLYSDYVVLDSSAHYIGVSPFDLSTLDKIENDLNHLSHIVNYGGVCLHYTSDNSYGIEGYLPKQRVGSVIFARQTFSLGSNNFIAGWNFDYESLYLGEKNNTLGQYTKDSDSITIGTFGIRGYSWYIDTDGTASFSKGLVKLSEKESLISNWTLATNALSSTYIRLSNSATSAGVYMCDRSILSLSDKDIKAQIIDSGGIFLALENEGVELQGVKNGKQIFRLASVGISKIAGWSFDSESLYIGTKNDSIDQFTDSNAITIGLKGIRSSAWRFEANGSGGFAKDSITWDIDGNVTFKNDLSIEWIIPGISDKLTKIDKDGIYTGTISANDITSGTISTADIKNMDGTWRLNQDGSGILANGNINWTATGKLVAKSITVKNSIMTNVKINGTVRQPWARSGIYINIGDNESVAFDNIAAGGSGGWGDGSIDSMVTWTTADSGRIIRIANWKFEGETFTGFTDVTAPEGKFFFEDGISKQKISFSREIIVLIGYGDSSTFYGWVVLNRIDLMTTSMYGQNSKVLAVGQVIGTDSGASISYKSFDGGKCTVSRRDTGKYMVWIPWVNNKYTVLLTGINSPYGAAIKASLDGVASNAFEVHTSDDASLNDGSFNFQIISTADWV